MEAKISKLAGRLLMAVGISGGPAADNYGDSVTPAGTKNGVNTIFTLSNPPITDTLRLFLNGFLLEYGSDYTLAGSTITYVDFIPTSEDIHVAYYRY